MSKGEILAEFREAIKGPDNRYIHDWKKSGGGVIGYFCTYVPLELFTAAGMLPVRIRGAGCDDSGPADAYLSNRVCTFVRHSTTLALEEMYDFLDGAVFLNTCDHVRRANDVWKAKTGIGFFGMISVPRTVREPLLSWYMEEVENVRSQIEDHFGVKVTDDSLREAIDLHNQVRGRLIELNELRAREVPPLTGEEMLVIAVASQLMPPDQFVELADELLPELGDADPEERRLGRIQRQDVKKTGILSVLGSTLELPSSPFGSSSPLGSDHENYLGALMGTSFGPNFGFDGLGMVGTGDGGAGDGEGTIGLGPGIWTKIGHGAYGGPDGVGYCPPGKVCGGKLSGKPPGKVPSKVKITGQGHVVGCIGKEAIRRVIRQHLNEVRFCYEKGLADRPDLEGRVQVGFVIKSDGSVGGAKIKDSSLGDKGVEQCIAKAVERWTFPAPEGCGLVIVSYPFNLVPASG